MGPDERYQWLRAVVEREPKPCVLVDLDAFEANIDRHVAVVRASGKTLRPASKSVRCVDLLRRIQARGGDVVQGTMAYAVTEAAFLVERDFDDLFVAYPTMQPSDAELLADLATRATVAVVVDDPRQLDLLEASGARRGVRIPVVVEVDLAWRPAGGVHLGARRSPLRTAAAVVALAFDADRRDHTRFHGVMGYESQVAGLQDANPFAPLLNPAKRFIRARSRPRVAATRAAIATGLAEAGLAGLFNGGGTGSLLWTTREDAVTEVTAGSGFLAPHLFDYFSGGRVPLEPAIAFALQVVRIPGPGLATCHGGGWIASGEAGPDKLPSPWLPEGVRLLPAEGAGEVQTPLRTSGDLRPGDPVFFRPAKAGEPAEHTREYLLVRGDRVEARVPTYRGEGGCFL